MTETEKREKNAEALTLYVGGVLALLLLEPLGRGRVSFKNGEFYLDGRRVSVDTIREQIIRLEIKMSIRIGEYARLLHDGVWSIERWREEMADLIVAGQIVAGALAAGSIKKAIENADVKARSDEQKKYLDGFTGEILAASATGAIFVGMAARQKIAEGDLSVSRYSEKQSRTAPAPQLSPNRIRSRSKSYVLAAAVTFAAVHMAVSKAIGKKEARRVRRAAESCNACIYWSYKWFPIDEMPAIGTLTCGHWCRCYIEYR